MSELIYPRSPRESMCGWLHLPRFIDKIRLLAAGKLDADYQPNYGKGFDSWWLEAAGLSLAQFEAVVKASLTDGEVADWVLKNVNRTKTTSDREAHQRRMLDYPRADDTAGQDRLKSRKDQAGLSHREDIHGFVDFIDADEKRS